MRRAAGAALLGAAALGVGGWWALDRLGAFAPTMGVTNRSGAVLRDLRVCMTGAGCRTRAALAPNTTWDAGLRPVQDGAAWLEFAGSRDPDASGYVTPGLRLEFRVFGPNRVEVVPR